MVQNERTENQDGRRPDTLSAADYLAQQLKEHGLDQSRLAEMTGVSRQTVNAIVRGRQPISRAMSARLGELFGQPADFWLREQFRRASQRLSEPEPGTAADHEIRPQDAGSGGPRSKILTDDEIRRAIEDGQVSIDPFDPGRINAASLDLCLGRIDAMGHQAPPQGSGDGVIDIAPLQCAHAWSRETVRLPEYMLARVGPMARLSHLGLFLGHGLQVDPGFEGELAFSLFNASPNPISLRPGEAVLTIELVHLGSPSAQPIDTGAATGDFADRAAAQFAASDARDRVIRHLSARMETTGLDGGSTYISRIGGTDIEAESEDRTAAQDACIDTCLRIIRDEAETEIHRRSRSNRCTGLEKILGELQLSQEDFGILLSEATLIDREGGSATVLTPARNRRTIPYPDGAISVRVRQLASASYLNVSAFVLVHHLICEGRDSTVFPHDV